MSKFKGTNGKWKTVSLFLEHEYDPTEAIFTFKDDHHEVNGKTFLSARRLFVGLGDPTGYQFSQEHLGGYSHWKAFVSSPKIAPYVAEWQEELEVLLRSQAIRTVVGDAASESRSSVSSAKWLSDKGWVEKRKAGAPSREEKQRELKVHTRIKTELDDDIERMLN
jgi:hypothetical protein